MKRSDGHTIPSNRDDAMRVRDKLELARFLIARVALEVKSKGDRHHHSATHPGYWSYGSNGLQFALTENVLLRPNDAVTSSSLDVWPDGGRKVFSVSWKPEQPWLPPEVATCKRGPWVEQLRLLGRS
jgi:hypothetical protein